MKRFSLGLAVGVVSIATLALASAGPESMDLKELFHVEGKKEAVVFPHWKHQEKLACTKCHDSDQGGKLSITPQNLAGSANDFHKKICWPCHVEMKVPKGKTCSTCHAKK